MYNFPKVSVIVPAFKVGGYIDKCLTSLLVQDYPNYEIIVVLRKDSDDDTRSKVLNFHTEHKVKIIYQKTKGLSAARNIALDHLTGTYLTFVDGDDFVDANHLSNLLNNVNDNIDVVCSTPKFSIHSSNSIIDSRIKYFSCDLKGIYNTDFDILQKIPVVAWGKLYRVSIINSFALRFPEDLIFEDNYFFWVYMSHARALFMTDVKTYNYLIRDDSLFAEAANKRSNTGCDNIYVLQRIVNHLSEFGRYDLIKPKLIARYYFNSLEITSKQEFHIIDAVLSDLIKDFNLFFIIKFLFRFCKKFQLWHDFLYFFVASLSKKRRYQLLKKLSTFI